MMVGGHASILLLMIVPLSRGNIEAVSSNVLDFLLDFGTIDHRTLQEQLSNDTAKCYSTLDASNPNRYCVFDSTPREGTFLVISCPDSKGEDLYQCSCSIGVGNPADAPNTPTCERCSFCTDETLSYNCQNVASGTCIGRDCGDNCVASIDSAPMSRGRFLVPLVALATSLLMWTT